MVTKSLAETPFGKKLVYSIDGECIWSEYLPFSKSKQLRDPATAAAGGGGVLSHIRRGVRSMLLRRAS